MPIHDSDPIKAAPDGVASQILEAFKSQASDFTISTSVGVTLHFAHLGQFSAIRQLYRDAEAASEQFKVIAATQEEWKPYAKAKKDDVQMAYIVAAMSTEPTKLSHLEALRIAVDAGPIFAEILYELNAATNYQSASGMADMVDQSKKESPTPQTTESS